MSNEAVRDYLAFFNEEAIAGRAAATAILATPEDEWDHLLATNAGWMRFGTFDALLRVAHQKLDAEPRRALTIAQFVLKYIERLTTPFSRDFLLPQLRGTSWKELANALFALEDYERAEVPAAAAVAAFGEHPVLVVDQAAARLVQAEIWAYQKRIDEAIVALDAALEVFAAHGDAQHWVQAVEVRGIIAFNLGKMKTANKLFRRALSEADRRGDRRERARLLNGLGHCAVQLRRFEEAADYFSQAFVLFTEEGMFGEVQRAIHGTALVAKERGDLPAALDALQIVYAEVLRRGLVPLAGRVLVEISDVVAKMAGDLPRARLLCGAFETAIAPYSVSGDLHRAAVYLQERTREATTAEAFAGALEPFRKYFTQLSVDPSTTFRPPEGLTA